MAETKVAKIVSTQSKEDFEMPSGEDEDLEKSPKSKTSFENNTISSRMVLDCMGHYSNIVKQIRGGAKPDGIVMVAGGCAQANWPDNSGGDILYTMTGLSVCSSPRGYYVDLTHFTRLPLSMNLHFEESKVSK